MQELHSKTVKYRTKRRVSVRLMPRKRESFGDFTVDFAEGCNLSAK